MLKEEIQLSIQERKLKRANDKIDILEALIYREIKDEYLLKELKLKLRAVQ